MTADKNIGRKMTKRVKILYIVGFSTFILGVLGMSGVFSVENLSESVIATHQQYLNLKSNSDILDPDKDNVILGNQFDDLLWFVQVTDLHISKFHAPERISDFKNFCRQTVMDTIKPKLVIVTGDITDAKYPDLTGSRQFEEEWISYSEILTDCQVESKVPWLDMKGNHDMFDVPSAEAMDRNPFRHYSVQGRSHPRSYLHTMDYNNKSYSFIGVDATLSPGPKRPFNFFGLLTTKEMATLEALAKKATAKSDYVIYFGHYPTSTILSPSSSIRQLVSETGMAYLCGHLHTLLGHVPNMYVTHPNGMLELELGDWKDNRVFRVLTLDHGMLSFSDLELKSEDDPIVVVTNPKNPAFNVPQHEPLHRISRSTHVRLLVFATTAITSVEIQFDDRSEITLAQHIDGPLYTAKWNPSDFATDLHQLTVRVAVKASDDPFVTTHPFSLDGTVPHSSLMGWIILSFNLMGISQIMFGLTVVGIVLPLCFLRLLHHFIVNGSLKALPHRLQGFVCGNILRKLWLLVTIDQLFYPLILSTLYLPFGPWAFGYFLTDKIGVLFSWGIFINGSFLPGDSTNVYGTFHVLFIQVPLIVILANLVDRKSRDVGVPDAFFVYLWQNSGIVLLMMFLSLQCYWFMMAYGWLALLGPKWLGQAFLCYHLWNLAAALRGKDFLNANLVWQKIPSKSLQ